MWSLRGIRVVQVSNSKGGDSIVGTITEVNYNEETITVFWDDGGEAVYPCTEGNHCVKILDNAPTGVSHRGISCTGCKESEIAGMRWVCLQCQEVNMCSICYKSRKHNTEHEFGRVTHPDSSVIKVGKRKTSSCVKCRGFFPGAKVKRGPHWKWGNSNGGEEVHGVVRDICDWGPRGYRGAVRVCWENKKRTVEQYRVGGDGEVDLTAVKTADGPTYYPDHLPYVDVEHVAPCEYRIGDKVLINLSTSELRVLQLSSSCGWQDQMASCKDNIGTITHISSASQTRVHYQNGQVFHFEKIVLTKVHRLEVGDLVRVMRDRSIALKLQQGHGGWLQNQDTTLGQLGRVVHIDGDGDVSVKFGDSQYLFSPVCLDVVDPNSLSAMARVPSIPNNLHSLRLFDLTQPKQAGYLPPITSIVKAASKGNVEIVKEILNNNKDKVDEVENGVSCLQVASHRGHEKMVKLLLERGANINKADKDGNTSLHFAVQGKKTAVIKLLLEHNANVSSLNSSGQTAIHLAIAKEQKESIKALVLAPCDVHVKDGNGDTAVHAAISTRQEALLHAVLRTHRVNFQTENTAGYDMLQWAVYKNFKSAVDVILTRCSHCLPELVSRQIAINGYSALHLAACYDHRECAHLLITKKPNSEKTHCYVQIACLLVENGAELNLENQQGKTPLDFTCQQSRLYLERISKAAKEKRAANSGEGLFLPLHWSEMGSKGYELVCLNRDSLEEKAEFTSVSAMIVNGLPNAEVTEIIRVQNEYLWQLYSVTKAKFTKKYGRGNENEVKLLHGTKSDNIFKICQENFDFKVAGENLSPMYGKGVYFAAESSLSDHYCSEKERDGLKYMLMARVLAGKMGCGSPEIRRPPDDCDCAVDSPSKPRIFCVFDYNQLYPEYVIKYKIKQPK
uniref:E3 ubiquitin-protein ligase mind-bomb n=1 Tax=Magallana gigas TaxID=29159 RepID=K1PFI4_MAGGI